MKSIPSIVFILLIFPTLLISQEVDILTEKEAAMRITQDTMDGFFEKVRPLEVSIQMKDPSLSVLPQSEAIQRLKEGLRNEVVSPGDKEKEILRESMKIALQLSKPFTHDHELPDTIFIGVLKGNVYGESTFFTRENGIFVPQGLLNPAFQANLTEVLIHEIFHIQSRFHPELQDKLYAEIGFQALEEVPEMDSAFRNRVLVNPDGTDWQYYIPLVQGDDTVLAYPMIVSNEGKFLPQKQQFFAYLQFQLFPLKKTEKGYEVQYSEGFRGVDPDWMPIFFDSIEDNTQYIIHPDEITADNFVLLTKIKDGRPTKKLSEEGKELLIRLANVYQVPLEMN